MDGTTAESIYYRLYDDMRRCQVGYYLEALMRTTGAYMAPIKPFTSQAQETATVLVSGTAERLLAFDEVLQSILAASTGQ